MQKDKNKTKMITSLRLESGLYFAIRALAAKASAAEGRNITITEYMESYVVKPHIDNSKKI